MRKNLDYATKLAIIRDLQSGTSHSVLASSYAVSRTLITKLNNKGVQSFIEEQCAKLVNGGEKRCRSTERRHKALEAELLDWLGEIRQKKLIVTCMALRFKALQIREALMLSLPEGTRKEMIANFRCSEGWLHEFKRRNSIRLQSTKGMEDALHQDEVAVARRKMKEATAEYRPEDVFNADETGLFYRQLPTTTLVLSKQTSKEHQPAKERITVLLCCSSSGEQLKPLVVGKSARPRALKSSALGSLPCRYTFNENSWVTRAIFKEWLLSVNEEQAMAGRHICLVLDNFTGHVLDITFSNVKLVYLSPGMTSMLQPLDCGIIYSFKTKYKNKLVQLYLDQSANGVSRKIDIRKAIDYVATAWNEVSIDTIANCWRHADILCSNGLYLLADAAFQS